MLHQPVLGPVNIRRRNWVLESIEPLEEGLVLQGVLLAVVVGLGSAEETPLVVEVRSHLGLQVGQVHRALRGMAKFSDVVEENLVLVINASIESLNTVVPVVGLGDVVGQQVDVLEVGVLDVLHQPVLGLKKLYMRIYLVLSMKISPRSTQTQEQVLSICRTFQGKHCVFQDGRRYRRETWFA